jgi:hypothetical protein
MRGGRAAGANRAWFASAWFPQLQPEVQESKRPKLIWFFGGAIAIPGAKVNFNQLGEKQ